MESGVPHSPLPFLDSSFSPLLPPLLSRRHPGVWGRWVKAAEEFGKCCQGGRDSSIFLLISDLEITVPIRHSQLLPGKVEYGVYESGPRKSVLPPRTELRRGDWKTDSTSSTASEQLMGPPWPPLWA